MEYPVTYQIVHLRGRKVRYFMYTARLVRRSDNIKKKDVA